MMLKAVLFDFNGIIINDEALHEQLLEQLLIEENLRPQRAEFQEVCLGRSDRACLRDLLERRGRVVTDAYLDILIRRKAQAYRQALDGLETLPIYPGLEDFLFKLQGQGVPMGVVSGALRSEIELVLTRSHLAKYFTVMVGGDEISASKPDPEGYLLAVDRLNAALPDLQLQPQNCLAIEDTYPGIRAAKGAGMQVLGVANTHPFQMMHRTANWVVDYLTEVDLEHVRRVFSANAA
ncbi:HAD family phosphatase [Geitlerinema sp. PCC 7407]|uniref:HAD family hydrolase n=1 Tax=Geitlerinema sp. PCC 7407 TaxID=1173025 RepID=UPI00029F98F7|nr:HAD family phosphatase [Geitlerinema sp. PCC 7407]AFY64662.1 HAD-superfamily hydrolase, subfamily IA, variant 3 [Geitlerinema sp. PCC 7407]